MITHINIELLRSIFKLYQSKSVDDKAFGGMFLELIDDIKL